VGNGITSPILDPLFLRWWKFGCHFFLGRFLFRRLPNPVMSAVRMIKKVGERVDTPFSLQQFVVSFVLLSTFEAFDPCFAT
jgi:hypothetical protein